MKTRPVLLAGSLDTKGEENLFLKSSLQRAGLATLVLDIGVLAEPLFAPDISREEVADCAGASAAELKRAADRGNAVATMQHGLTEWVIQHGGSIGGMLGIGGSAGTSIITAAMRELPIGTPKLMVSTMASGDVRPYVGTSDILMMYSVTDFNGLNRLTRAVLSNAASAMAGMCLTSQDVPTTGKPLLAATMFGNTTPCVTRVKELLEREGYEILVFHATGTGGIAMEKLVRDGFIRGVLDITTTELADELVGGVLTAGPHRLEITGRMGIPQIVSVGALDMVNFGPPETVPEKFSSRRFYPHNPAVTLMRTTPEENTRLGEIIAAKLNQSVGPITVMLPLRGVSAIDVEGQPFYDPLADEHLFRALKTNLKPTTKVVELDMTINDQRFAERLASEFIALTPLTKTPTLQGVHGQ